MEDNFPAWWAFAMAPNHDGNAKDTADDGAGETRWGWTYGTWVEARSFIGARADLLLFRAMEIEQAAVLAQIYFWQRFGGDALPSGPDVCLIDFRWNSGGAVRLIQTVLGIDSDDVVGPQTIGAITAFGAPEFIGACYAARVIYYDDLGFRERFPGLYTRATDIAALGRVLLKGGT